MSLTKSGLHILLALLLGAGPALANISQDLRTDDPWLRMTEQIAAGAPIEKAVARALPHLARETMSAEKLTRLFKDALNARGIHLSDAEITRRLALAEVKALNSLQLEPREVRVAMGLPFIFSLSANTLGALMCATNVISGATCLVVAAVSLAVGFAAAYQEAYPDRRPLY